MHYALAILLSTVFGTTTAFWTFTKIGQFNKLGNC